MIRPLPRWFVLTSALFAASTAAAANTPAGTLIENQATATFHPVTSGGQTSATSNRVVTVVQGVCAVSITPNGQDSVFAMGGDQVSFGFTITNAGNKDYGFPLNVSASGLSPAPQVSLYLDANGNNLVDNGERPVSSLNLPASSTAKVIAVVSIPVDGRGEALIKLVTTCGAAGGAVSATARILVAPPPTLEVQKNFSPTIIRPGSSTTVTVTTTNTSYYASREVVLTDMLTEQLALGLTFVPGSARTNVGVIEYTADGNTWSSSMPAVVRGLRVRVLTLEPDDSIQLTFAMQADEKAEGKEVVNIAVASTGQHNTNGAAKAEVRYQPAVAIGPVGNPTAPEGTPADSQSKAFAVVGQQVCFDHTVQNTGDVKDNFRITVTFPEGQADTQVLGAGGQPLVQPLMLGVNETALVRVCYTPKVGGKLTAEVSVTGERGTSNTTTDTVQQVLEGLPELEKSYTASGVNETGQVVDIQGGDTVKVGDTVVYTLKVRNPYTLPLHNVVVTDPIPAHVDFMSASEAGTVIGTQGEQTITWNLGTLAPGETRSLTITTKVSDRAVDGEVLKNIFQMVSTELPEPTSSNPVNTPVWSSTLIISKGVSKTTVVYGDRITYTLKIRNTSSTTPVENVVITDTPAKGLEYLPGTSLLDGKAVADPVVANGSMAWTVPSIPANGEITVQYDMRITPEATPEMVNIATASGIGAGGAGRAIASGKAEKLVHLDPLKFAPLADIIGTVFVDRNRNGLYDAGLDTPVDRARVILAGGRLALTDAAGRYHFSNVPHGTWALRLDPTTTPYPPLKLPQEGGLSGTQTVHIRGLTSVDFPLAPLGGEVTALRRTTLTIADVTVEKAVYAVQGGYVVTLKITTPRALSEFRLVDPLPGGATLKEGGNTLSTNLDAGENYLTYRFDWTGEPKAATTDPTVSWRY